MAGATDPLLHYQPMSLSGLLLFMVAARADHPGEVANPAGAGLLLAW